MEVGEFVKADQWVAPLHMTWWSLWVPAVRLLSLLRGDVDAFKASLPVNAIKEVVSMLEGASVETTDE